MQPLALLCMRNGENSKTRNFKEIEAYNEQDCRSMPLMRQWLESVVFKNQIVLEIQ